MKTFPCIATSLLILSASLQAFDLTVDLNKPPTGGSIEILLFDSPSTFRELKKPAHKSRIPATGQSTFVLRNIPSGEYALMVHHDENDNSELDKNFIGIPREPTGFANGYSPKGPPNYQRALIRTNIQNPQPVPVALSRPLGERGRFGAGVGIIMRSSPYKGSDSGTVLPIPALTYSGERLQVFGPRLRFMLAGNDTLRLALAANYRPGAYDEDDSHDLQGLGDRKATLMAGPELRAELPAGLDLSLGYRHDVLDRIGGGEADVSLGKSFSLGDIRLTPDIGLCWTSSELVNHDYGTPGYHPGSTVTAEAGLSLLFEINENWWLSGRIGAERLSDDITDSPIVDDDLLIKSFFAVSYIF